jgi:hypothetical protein
VPAPPVLGTRERSCPFHPCMGPESQPAFCDGPDPTPPTAGLVGGNSEVRECRAGPGWPSENWQPWVRDRPPAKPLVIGSQINFDITRIARPSHARNPEFAASWV